MMKKLLFLAAVAIFGLSACDLIEPFQFATFSLRNGVVGETYADTIYTVGGYGNVTMRLVDGQLPPGVGLRVSDRDGILYGRPDRSGDYLFTVEARDSSGDRDSSRGSIITQGFALTVDSL